MTLGSFVVRNAFRNKRRSLLTMISIGFSLLLLTLMICIWRSFYVDQVAPEAARRLIVRDRVSLAFLSARILPRQNPLGDGRDRGRAHHMVRGTLY